MIIKKRVSKVDTPSLKCCFLYNVDNAHGRPLSADMYHFKFYYLLKIYTALYNLILWRIFV